MCAQIKRHRRYDLILSSSRSSWRENSRSGAGVYILVGALSRASRGSVISSTCGPFSSISAQSPQKEQALEEEGVVWIRASVQQIPGALSRSCWGGWGKTNNSFPCGVTVCGGETGN